jgi:hypothetical protein
MNTNSPAAPPDEIRRLRELLAQKFPSQASKPHSQLPTGLPILDDPLGGGLRKGGLVELVAERPSSGATSLLRAVLQNAAANGLWAGLIDGRDAFDPASLPPKALDHLLWLRCHTAAEAIQSADLLLRDGNLPLLCLDLHGNPAAELRRITGPQWYRLHRMLEPTAIAFLALTPFATIPCADLRLQLQGRFTLAALEEDPAHLWQEKITVALTRQRQSANENPELERLAG